MSVLLGVTVLSALLCWGVAKIINPAAGRVFNVVAVVLIGAALIMFVVGHASPA